MRTIYTRTLKDLARLAGRSQAIAFDLTEISIVGCEGFVRYDYLSLSTRLAIHALSRLTF
jgi:hypothetical protein